MFDVTLSVEIPVEIALILMALDLLMMLFA